MKKAKIPGRARVCGRAPFPIDMLRYDTCVPDSESDSSLISYSLTPGEHGRAYEIVVRKASPVAKAWTPQRWASFGWDLTPKD